VSFCRAQGQPPSESIHNQKEKSVTKGPTRFVDDEHAVENVRRQVARKLATLPRVDSQGRVIDKDQPTTVQVVGAPTPTPTASAANPSLAASIAGVAAALGANVAALTDSISFMSAVVDVDPSDTALLTKVVGDALASNPGLKAVPPTMKPNPGQGATSNGAPVAKPKTVQERVAARLAKLPQVDAQGHSVS
jgi:hypothetical protein